MTKPKIIPDKNFKSKMPMFPRHNTTIDAIFIFINKHALWILSITFILLCFLIPLPVPNKQAEPNYKQTLEEYRDWRSVLDTDILFCIREGGDVTFPHEMVKCRMPNGNIKYAWIDVNGTEVKYNQRWEEGIE